MKSAVRLMVVMSWKGMALIFVSVKLLSFKRINYCRLICISFCFLGLKKKRILFLINIKVNYVLIAL